MRVDEPLKHIYCVSIFIFRGDTGAIVSFLKRNFKSKFKKELYNRNLKRNFKTRKLKGTFTSKLKSHFEIEIKKGTYTSKFKRNFKLEIKKEL